ncbi:probable E3 ubiquitin-protein ligase HECTD2 [Branchiostoma floridae]|uniref:HECT-type E3 ubiquitin transferase n=3 Tax=Branchiostoma floridae TaxID=7739 RepID=A0A9J7KXY8_BRAFL|nr:probable E3 ubiquitin-protein ligase HECTD2 [Branchiostoma floridae]
MSSTQVGQQNLRPSTVACSQDATVSEETLAVGDGGKGLTEGRASSSSPRLPVNNAPSTTTTAGGSAGSTGLLPPISATTSKVMETDEQRKTHRPFAKISNFLSALRPRGGKQGEEKSVRKGSGRRRYVGNLPPIHPPQATPTCTSPLVTAPPTTPVRTSPTQPQQQQQQSPAKSQQPIIIRKTFQEFKDDATQAHSSGNFKTLQEFYSTSFDSFYQLVGTFQEESSTTRNPTEHPGVAVQLLDAAYSELMELPQDIQKVVLRGIVNSLLQKDIKGPRSFNDLRAYFIFLKNPQFSHVKTYVIFAHLIRHLAHLEDKEHQVLVGWMRRLPAVQFRDIVDRLLQFISVRLFPPKQDELPPLAKCGWWIPSATKVLALFNAANNICVPMKIPHSHFYNSALDHIDLMAEYMAWQNPATHPGFSFCQYPYILSIAAKRKILQRDSEHQMIMNARRSLVQKVQRRQMPDMGMLFLNLNVRRSQLVSDSVNEIMQKRGDLKKKLKVNFVGEPGLDMGGLTKEWFLLLLKQIFQPEYGMFTYDDKAHCYWFSSIKVDNYSEFHLVGVLMGLAVYNSIILDMRFPPCCYKKLLSPAVVPYGNPRARVGLVSLTVDDLQQTMPDLAHGLKELLEYEGNVEEDLCMTFQVSRTEFGIVRTMNLKPGGDKIPVTNENRAEFVQSYVNWLLNESIYHQFSAFYYGFHGVCASNALLLLRPEEVETLVCGSPELDMFALMRVTEYEGYSRADPTVKAFWEVVLFMPVPLQKKFLLFCTGSDRIPVGGMAEMVFKIVRINASLNMLPIAHTCFNQLCLPPYKSKKHLAQKLLIAIQNAEGFGLE